MPEVLGFEEHCQGCVCALHAGEVPRGSIIRREVCAEPEPSGVPSAPLPQLPFPRGGTGRLVCSVSTLAGRRCCELFTRQSRIVPTP